MIAERKRLKAERDRWRKKYKRRSKPQWYKLFKYFDDRGFTVYRRKSKSTESVYITISQHGRFFTVRFSDHQPTPFTSADFSVGPGAMSLNAAIKACDRFFTGG